MKILKKLRIFKRIKKLEKRAEELKEMLGMYENFLKTYRRILSKCSLEGKEITAKNILILGNIEDSQIKVHPEYDLNVKVAPEAYLKLEGDKQMVTNSRFISEKAENKSEEVEE